MKLILELLQATYSDTYKDAYGTRPRHDRVADWTSVRYLVGEIKRLCILIGEQQSEERERERQAVERFETQINAMITNHGAADREAAIRWIHHAEGTEGDSDRLCYELGLPYRYFSKQN